MAASPVYTDRGHEYWPELKLRLLEEENARLKAALQVVIGRAPIAYDHEDKGYCAYCGEYPSDQPPHAIACPVTIARVALEA